MAARPQRHGLRCPTLWPRARLRTTNWGPLPTEGRPSRMHRRSPLCHGRPPAAGPAPRTARQLWAAVARATCSMACTPVDLRPSPSPASPEQRLPPAAKGRPDCRMPGQRWGARVAPAPSGAGHSGAPAAPLEPQLPPAPASVAPPQWARAGGTRKAASPWGRRRARGLLLQRPISPGAKSMAGLPPPHPPPPRGAPPPRCWPCQTPGPGCRDAAGRPRRPNPTPPQPPPGPAWRSARRADVHRRAQ